MALKFVNQSVSTMINGSRVRLTKDDPWRDTDPVVVAAPQFFDDEPSKVQTSVVPERAAADSDPVEQATAEPGQVRSTLRKTAAKK